ncbi:hypothetical protein MAR_006023 [Mya arenaria]|uniref:Uncharacterized protein n=1 Tax=Mya arenaria TaxID=6604 RepID=A0ABY7D7B6_MYAAR|nr:hypothetical protein MAR_006023 [Mya arenaria]
MCATNSLPEFVSINITTRTFKSFQPVCHTGCSVHLTIRMLQSSFLHWSCNGPLLCMDPLLYEYIPQMTWMNVQLLYPLSPTLEFGLNQRLRVFEIWLCLLTFLLHFFGMAVICLVITFLNR